MKKEKYLAHISEDKTREQTILEHAQATGELAGKFASSFDCEEWGRACGLMHDIGKYSEAFRRRLYGGPKVDHATAGAQELRKKGYIMAAYPVAGHHSGLPNGGTRGDQAGESTFYGRMAKKVEDYSAYQKELEVPELLSPPLKPLGKGGFSVAFFIRMLFSCLVDADYLDTEWFMTDGKIKRESSEDGKVLYERLQKHIEPWLLRQDTTTLNGRRTMILKSCLEKGQGERGLYQLTVPTGGGKTVASLAFALTQLVTHQMDRIIYAIPFISIIEQNAQVFRDILGTKNVLEDHSNTVCESEEEKEKERLAAENWDKKVVVTTNVNFFESLFSYKTSKCRKLHNVANSVIILDEAQMLPSQYLKPCVQALAELISNYHCTVVLCTATQPSLLQFFPKELSVQEICPDVQGQYEFFRRTKIIQVGKLTEKELREQLEREKQVLCVLNSRKRVQRMYRSMEGEGTYQLSTLMYPIERKRILKEIRERLKGGKICRVISTSLIEAGVDVDFETVYKELAGEDSVVQAAGRCNREGKRVLEECKTVVFTMDTEKDIHIPNELRLPISVTEEIGRSYEDLASLEAIHEYFERLYHYKGESLDAERIVEQFEEKIKTFSFPFKEVSDQFRLIKDKTTAILIEKDPEAQRIGEQIRYGMPSRELVRQAGQYCVNVFDKDLENLRGAGLLEELPMGFYALRKLDQYDNNTGLSLEVSRGDAVFM